MPLWLQAVTNELGRLNAGYYAVTALMAILWAASEVIIGSPEQPMRALRTRGAAVLMLINALFACLALGAALALIPGSASFWTALGVGLAWQSMLRGGINLQPLPLSPGADSEGMGVPLNELYKRLQGFCVDQIRRQLVEERVELIERAIARLTVPELAHIARLVTAALGSGSAEAEQYINRLENDQDYPEEQREIMLISLILDKGGGDILHSRLRERRRRR